MAGVFLINLSRVYDIEFREGDTLAPLSISANLKKSTWHQEIVLSDPPAKQEN